jgi:hypothetical protein
MRRVLRRGPLQMITALAIFAVGGAAFTAVNAVLQTSAGEGAATISSPSRTSTTTSTRRTRPTSARCPSLRRLTTTTA